ncbi:allograft inflammatory factor 1-like isoform X2 [Chanodichthys erythropterus]
MEDQKYRDEEDLQEKLDSFKNKYAEFDLNDQGEIDMMGMKRMMEKLGVPKTHLEMKKMISEVTGGCSDTINYRDFVKMMLGKRSAVLKLVMMFEDKANGTSGKPDGPPPKRDITSLP